MLHKSSIDSVGSCTGTQQEQYGAEPQMSDGDLETVLVRKAVMPPREMGHNQKEHLSRAETEDTGLSIAPAKPEACSSCPSQKPDTRASKDGKASRLVDFDAEAMMAPEGDLRITMRTNEDGVLGMLLQTEQQRVEQMPGKITRLDEATVREDAKAEADHRARTPPDESPGADGSSVSLRGGGSNFGDTVCRCGALGPHHKSRYSTLWSNAEALARLENSDGKNRKAEVEAINKKKWKAFRKRMERLRKVSKNGKNPALLWRWYPFRQRRLAR